MTLEECYREMGADYDGTLQRLYSQAFIKKMVFKFLDDTSFRSLQDAMNEKDREKAFRAAHTLKGVSQNLGFTGLYERSAALTEILRKEINPEAVFLLQKTEQEYGKLVKTITDFREQSM